MGKIFMNYYDSIYLYFSMGKFHREMNYLWGISNEKCQFIGFFHGEYKISGVSGEFTPLTGCVKAEPALTRILPCRGLC